MDDSMDASELDTSQTLDAGTIHKSEKPPENFGVWRTFEGLADIYEDIWGAKITRLHYH